MAFNFEFNGVPMSEGVKSFFSGLGEGAKNWWYNFTGQTEKTSAYKAMIEREDTAYQRAAEDMANAGLSKYAGVNPASSSAPPQASDPVSKSIQLVSALMDLRGQKAAIDKSEAETGYINAGTDLRLKEGMTFEEKFAADMANKNAQTFLFKMQGEIAQQENQTFAEKFTTDLAYTTARTLQAAAQTGYLNQLAGSESIRRNILQKDLEKYEFRFNMEKEAHSKEMALADKRIDELTESILRSTAQRYNMSWDSVLKHYDAARSYIEMEILSYNYQYSANHGLRTTDPASKVMGVNYDSFAEQVGNQLKGALDSVMNWGGILGLPSFNDLGLNPFGVSK